MAALPLWRRAANIVFRGFAWMFRTFRRALTLLVSVLLLASAFSDLVSPAVWIVASYLGLVFPLILIAALIWFFLLIAMRRWRLVILMLLVMIGCGNRIWRYVPLHFVSPSPIVAVEAGGDGVAAVDSFRIMTFNTRATGEAHVGKDTYPVPVMDLVRSCGADIVCLQEYYYSLNPGGHTEKQLRGMVSDIYPYYYHLLNSGRNDMGITIFSKWPIIKPQKIDSNTKDYCWAFYCELDVHGRRIGLVNCHLQTTSVSQADRKLYRQQIEHFEKDSIFRMEDGLRSLGPSFLKRAVQTGIINRFLADREGVDNMPLIICGDMNDTPISFTYHSMRGDLADSWEDAGFGPGISFRDAPFWFRIDHVFHSKHFHTLKARIRRDITYSDHYPVIIDFQLLPE